MNNKFNFNPQIIYVDSLIEKSRIYKDNKNKSGIYRWRNTLNNYTYIGSSKNISNRFYKYFSIKYLERKCSYDNSKICRALLNSKYINFNLEILEYCNESLLLEREQYFIDLLEPEYNILKYAGSSLGFKHSFDTLLKFKDRNFEKISKVTIVIDKNNNNFEYPSIRAAARSLKVSHSTLLKYINKDKLLKSEFLIKY